MKHLSRRHGVRGIVGKAGNGRCFSMQSAELGFQRGERALLQVEDSTKAIDSAPDVKSAPKVEAPETAPDRQRTPSAVLPVMAKARKVNIWQSPTDS